MGRHLSLRAPIRTAQTHTFTRIHALGLTNSLSGEAFWCTVAPMSSPLTAWLGGACDAKLCLSAAAVGFTTRWQGQDKDQIERRDGDHLVDVRVCVRV